MGVVRIWLWSCVFAPGLALAASPSEELMQANRLAEALPEAKREAAAARADMEAQERYYDLLLTLGLPHVAVADAKARVEANPADPDAHYLLGRAVPTAEAARSEYEAALRLDPDHARSQMGMGAVYRSVGQFDDAELAYRRALKLDPTLGEAWTSLGYLLLSAQRVPEALDTARKAVVAAPDEPEGYLVLALLAPAEAETVLSVGAKRMPHVPRLHAALAESRLSRGDGAGAGEAADRALAIDPGLADALLAQQFATSMAAGTIDGPGYLALVAARELETGDAKGALAAYDDLAARYPKSPLPRMARARTRAALGDTAGARADLERALVIDPRAVEAQAALGLLLLEADAHAEAKPLLVAAAQARPTDASLAVSAALAEAGSGEGKAAQARLEAATRAWPYDVRVGLTRASVLSAAGDLEGAYVVLKEAASRRPDGRLILALVAAANDTGRYGEAANILDELARQTGNRQWAEIADKTRAAAAARAKP